MNGAALTLVPTADELANQPPPWAGWGKPPEPELRRAGQKLYIPGSKKVVLKRLPVLFSTGSGSLLPHKVLGVNDAFADTILVDNEAFLDDVLLKQGILHVGRDGSFTTEGGPPPFSVAHFGSLIGRKAVHIVDRLGEQRKADPSLDPQASPKVTALVVEGVDGRPLVAIIRHSLNWGKGAGGTGWLASVASTKWGLRTKLPKGSQIIVQTRQM